MQGQGPHSRSIRRPECEVDVIAMIQQQQQLLHEILDTQKRMQSKDFDRKLQELAKKSESSSSSPDTSRKKVKISRVLTVSISSSNII